MRSSGGEAWFEPAGGFMFEETAGLVGTEVTAQHFIPASPVHGLQPLLGDEVPAFRLGVVRAADGAGHQRGDALGAHDMTCHWV